MNDFRLGGHGPPSTGRLSPIDRVVGCILVGRCRCRRGPAARGATARSVLLQALGLVINTDRSARKGALITEPGSVWKRREIDHCSF